MTGISLLPGARELRVFAGSVRWYADEASLMTLNDRIGYEEGVIDTETGQLKIPAFILHPEAPE